MMSAADDTDPAVGASRVGAELRAARLRLGWRLPDVASTLRIRLPYLEAIEEGRLSDLPGNAYAVGFLRSYATMLGLDAAEVARRFRAEAQEVNRKPDLAFPAPVPQRGVPAGAVVLLGVLIAVGAYAGWYRFSGNGPAPVVIVPKVPERLAPLADRTIPPSNPSPQVASILPSPSIATASVPPAGRAVPTPALNTATTVPVAPPSPVAPPAAPEPAAVEALPAADVPHLALKATADAWVQVRERHGAVLFNRVMRAGDTWIVPQGDDLLLTTGNAGGTELVVDGHDGPPLGGVGAVKRDLPLQTAAKQATAKQAAAQGTGSATTPGTAPGTPRGTLSTGKARTQ